MMEHAPSSWVTVPTSPRVMITVISQTATTLYRNDFIPELHQLHQCPSRTFLIVPANSRESICPTKCRGCRAPSLRTSGAQCQRVVSVSFPFGCCSTFIDIMQIIADVCNQTGATDLTACSDQM